MNDSFFRYVVRFATILAFGVIVLGAFVRLSDAGLGCPDWPTCYGKAAWPKHAQDVAAANEAFPDRPVEHHKAWKEQVHRHVAAILGALVLTLALRRNWVNPLRRALLFAAAIAAATGTFLYIGGYGAASVAASVIALGIPLAMTMGFGARGELPAWARFTAFLFALIMFQALLGMWTVTWQLKPIVVMAHLLGGLSVFAVLIWMAVRSAREVRVYPAAAWLRAWVWLGLAVLVVQIALGGWTSANYAALACGVDFPACLGQAWPATDFREAFVLWRGIGVDYEGGILDADARTAIHLSHRIGAIATTLVLGVVIAAMMRVKGLRGPALGLLVLLGLQITLGIGNVVLGLPLPVATAHNGVAALLIAQFVLILSRLTPARASAFAVDNRSPASRSGQSVAANHRP
jgi:cytochrome c oxidase assembly protein subunit 15